MTRGVGFKSLDALSARMAKLTGGRILPNGTVSETVTGSARTSSRSPG